MKSTIKTAIFAIFISGLIFNTAFADMINKKIETKKLNSQKSPTTFVDPSAKKAEEKIIENAKPAEFGLFGISVNGVFSVPIGDLTQVVNAGLGAEITGTLRHFIVNEFCLQLCGSYNNYTGKFDNSNTMQIISAKLLGRFDLFIENMPGCIFFTAGGGFAFERTTISPTSLDNIDAMFEGGIGYEVPLSPDTMLNFKLEYTYIPQKYVQGAVRDGSFINIIFGLNYELFGGKSEVSE